MFADLNRSIRDGFWRFGLVRNIERHNFIFKQIHLRRIESLPFSGRVVDLGCGEAPYRSKIVAKGCDFVGLDWPMTYHDPDVINVWADLERGIPLNQDCCHWACAFQVLEHLKEPGAFLAECFRILQPKGSLVISVPFLWHEHEAPHDYFRYTQYGLRYIIEKAGFEVVSIEAETGFWQTWCGSFNYYTLRWRNRFTKLPLYVLWWILQIASQVLDRYSKAQGAGMNSHYFVIARKPLSSSSE